MNPIPPNTASFSYELVVTDEHIDTLAHVNNVVYLKWVNDISERHWNRLAGKELKKKYFWVVLRHELDYLNQAVLSDRLLLRTWVGKSKGVKSIRHVEIYKGDILLLRAASIWCLIDAATLRPVRIKEDVLRILNTEDQQ